MQIIRAPRWTSTGRLPAPPAPGCAGTAPPVERVSVAPPPASRASALEAILAAARASLGKSHPQVDGQPISTECSGFVRDLYTRAGIDLFSEGQPSDGGVRAIARWVERHGGMTREKLPAPGDLAFFDNSYDRNGDGRLNDRLTHVGFVEGVLADGTVLVIHATNHGIVREPMNLLHPHETTVNAPLRRRSANDAPATPHLMSELFAGFGRVLPVSSPGPQSRRSLHNRSTNPAGSRARRRSSRLRLPPDGARWPS